MYKRQENGIDYLVYSKQYPGDTSQLSGLVVVYENADVTIYACLLYTSRCV